MGLIGKAPDLLCNHRCPRHLHGVLYTVHTWPRYTTAILSLFTNLFDKDGAARAGVRRTGQQVHAYLGAV